MFLSTTETPCCSLRTADCAVLRCGVLHCGVCCTTVLQVQQYLDQFISDMKNLFEKHKKAAGYPDCKLVVL